MVDYILNRLGLTKTLECVQAVYMNKTKLDTKKELEIRQLEQNQILSYLIHFKFYCKLSFLES